MSGASNGGGEPHYFDGATWRTKTGELADHAPDCAVYFAVGKLRCVREGGHPGPHKGPLSGLWFNDMGERVYGASAEDYA